MAKIAIIGAGSIVFCQTLSLDILGTPGLKFGIARERLHFFDRTSGLRFAA